MLVTEIVCLKSGFGRLLACACAVSGVLLIILMLPKFLTMFIDLYEIAKTTDYFRESKNYEEEENLDGETVIYRNTPVSVRLNTVHPLHMPPWRLHLNKHMNCDTHSAETLVIPNSNNFYQPEAKDTSKPNHNHFFTSKRVNVAIEKHVNDSDKENEEHSDFEETDDCRENNITEDNGEASPCSRDETGDAEKMS